MTDSVREVLAKAFNGKCGESIYRSETAMTSEDAQQEVQSGIDHLLDDLKAAGLTITDAARLAELEAAAVWNTDMDAAPKDGTEVRLKVTDARRQEVFEAIGYWGEMIDSDGDGWTSGRVADWGYQDVMRLNPIAWQTLTPHEGG